MSQFSLFHLFKSIVSLADDLRKPLIRMFMFASVCRAVARRGVCLVGADFCCVGGRQRALFVAYRLDGVVAIGERLPLVRAEFRL